MNNKKGFGDLMGAPRGDFRCETICAETGKIVDFHEKHNLIMTDARTVISKLFAGMVDAQLPNKFMLGTDGHQSGQILIPKDAADGFIKSRSTIFSDVVGEFYPGDIVELVKNSYIEYHGSDEAYTGLYKYIGNTIIDLTLSDVLIQASDFEYLEDLPDIYATEFTCPGTYTDLEDGDDASATNGATVKVLLSGTSVTFSLEVGTSYGNGPGGTNIYTEAGIFAGDDIFCMKTFPAKIKDETVIFRVIWTITF